MAAPRPNHPDDDDADAEREFGVFRLTERVDLMPVVHGSGDFAVAVRERLLAGGYRTLAVPLPPSFAEPVLELVEMLPAITAVVQIEPGEESANYAPIDPCQPVIAGIRTALAERMRIEFIDPDFPVFEATALITPDAYALKGCRPEAFAAALLPGLPPPPENSLTARRIEHLAAELTRLAIEPGRTLALVGFAEWPWVRRAFANRPRPAEVDAEYAPLRRCAVAPKTLAFFLGELPFITARYEQARRTLDPDEHLSIDGVRLLMLEARDRFEASRPDHRRRLTPKLMQSFFRYVRNRTLLGHRLTPDLFTLVSSAQQIGGDGFALATLETARDYPIEHPPANLETLRLGIGRGELGSGGPLPMVSRLPGFPVSWRELKIRPEAEPKRRSKWKTLWDPTRQCSWVPEDHRIERFHDRAKERARAMIGADLARSEKFTTSVKDGLDIRETLRNWHTGDLYVRELPPSRGDIEMVVFLFDVPADPERYTWRTTWSAEFEWESTISFFATDFRQDVIGPGVARSRYGGVLFVHPPRLFPDIWHDPRLPRVSSPEDRLIAGALFNSRETHVAVVCPGGLKSSWKKLARASRKRLIHLPLSRFSASTIDRLRTFHVLNGREVRSWAARYIRDE